MQCTGISQAEFYAAVESLQINGIDLRRSEASSEVDGRIRFLLRHNLLLFPVAKEQWTELYTICVGFFMQKICPAGFFLIHKRSVYFKT